MATNANQNENTRYVVTGWLMNAVTLTPKEKQVEAAYLFSLHASLKMISKAQQASETEINYETFLEAFEFIATKKSRQVQANSTLADIGILSKDFKDFIRISSIHEWLIKSVYLSPSCDHDLYKRALHGAFIALACTGNNFFFPCNNNEAVVPYAFPLNNNQAMDPFGRNNYAPNNQRNNERPYMEYQWFCDIFDKIHASIRKSGFMPAVK